METKLNDSCPLGRELETDELKNVSGGADGALSSAVVKTLGGHAKIVDGRFEIMAR